MSSRETGPDATGASAPPTTAHVQDESGSAASERDELSFFSEHGRRRKAKKKRFLKMAIGAVVLALLLVTGQQVFPAIKERIVGRLPKFYEAEESMRMLEVGGKLLIASSLSKETATHLVRDKALNGGFNKLANILAGKLVPSIIGQNITLCDVRPVGLSETNDVPTEFTVTGFLGVGSSSVTLEVVERNTGQRMAMRMHYFLAIDELDDEEAAEAAYATKQEELENMEIALGGLPATKAASEKGLAVSLYEGRIANMPNVVSTPHVSIANEVQLSERMYGDLETLMLKSDTLLDQGAKLYIARRLLLSVLHLQQAKLSHNDIKTDNVFLREDGTPLLGDFGSSTPFGAPMERATGISLPFAEPLTAIQYIKFLEYEGDPVIADPKSDMFSLGVALYEIFMDGQLPPGFTIPSNENRLDKAMELFENILEEERDPRVLEPEMQEAGVPVQWQALIVGLLQVDRAKRLSASDIAAEFSGLYV